MNRRRLLKSVGCGTVLFFSGCSETINGEFRNGSRETSSGENRSALSTKSYDEANAWPLARYNTANTGVHPTAKGPQRNPEATQITQTGGEISWFSLPIILDDTAYISKTTGAVAAIDTSTGKPIWNANLPGPVISPVAIANEAVYACTPGGQTTHLIALSLADGANVWKYSFDHGGDTVAPIIVDNTIYMGNGYSVYALNSLTGKKQWESNIPTEATIGGIGVKGNTVYVSYGGSRGGITALNATDGSQRWIKSLRSEVSVQPVIADGTVYVGTHDGYIHAFNTADGTRKWQRKITIASEGVRTPIAIADGIVYVGSNNSTEAVALNATNGMEQWRVKTGISFVGPTIVDGTVYLEGNGTLYALTPTGKQKYQLDKGIGHPVSSFAVAGDRLYYVDGNSELHAVR